MSDSPRLWCLRRDAGPLSADVAARWWQGIAPVTLRENVGGAEPPQSTRVRTLWDPTGFRVLFDNEDRDPWATLTQRDGPLWTEEVVEIFFDPVGDLESYFEVEINPLGTVVDLVLRRTVSGWRKDFAWQVTGLSTFVRRFPGGWAAELAIPFAAVTNEPPRTGAAWRVNFLRIDRPLGTGTEPDLSAWSPTGIRNFHRPESFGTMEFADA